MLAPCWTVLTPRGVLDDLGDFLGRDQPLLQRVLVERDLNAHVRDVRRDVAQCEDLGRLDAPDDLVGLLAFGRVLVLG